MAGKKNVREKEKILIYAHYYFPDVASTAQILRELAEGLQDVFAVTVICVVPSYQGTVDEKYKRRKFYTEKINGIEVFRIRVPEFSKENKMSHIKNILSYFLGAIVATFKVGRQDYIFSISQPPVLGGLLGVWGKWVKHARYIYNIQDYNPEQAMAIGYCNSQIVLKMMMSMDKFSCRHSDLVITVGRDLVETLKKRFQGQRMPHVALINNWVNEKEIYPLETGDKKVLAFKKKYGLEDKFIVMYSGNIGLYYDLKNILKVISKFKPGIKAANGCDVIFAFVGAGSVLDKLIHYKNTHHLDHVVFIPYQKKEDLNYSLNAGDIHWVVNAKGIKGVSCPSKFYGIVSSGKPVLGVLEKGTEIRCLIEEIGCGLVCEPGDYDAIEDNIKWFLDRAGSDTLRVMGERGYRYSLQHFAKNISVEKYKKAILEL